VPQDLPLEKARTLAYASARALEQGQPHQAYDLLKKAIEAIGAEYADTSRRAKDDTSLAIRRAENLYGQGESEEAVSCLYGALMTRVRIYLKRHGLAVPAGVFCPSCSAVLPPGSRFCEVCGARIETLDVGGEVAGVERAEETVTDSAQEAEADKTQFCTNCGQPLEPGSRFCTACGASVE
jgi:hypothetical protein